MPCSCLKTVLPCATPATAEMNVRAPTGASRIPPKDDWMAQSKPVILSRLTHTRLFCPKKYCQSSPVRQAKRPLRQDSSGLAPNIATLTALFFPRSAPTIYPDASPFDRNSRCGDLDACFAKLCFCFCFKYLDVGLVISWNDPSRRVPEPQRSALRAERQKAQGSGNEVIGEHLQP